MSYVKIGDTNWPSPRETIADSADVVWLLRFADQLPMWSRHIAASYVDAYRQLVAMPARRRAQIIRELRKAEAMRR